MNRRTNRLRVLGASLAVDLWAGSLRMAAWAFLYMSSSESLSMPFLMNAARTSEPIGTSRRQIAILHKRTTGD
jgi:hypothetical protein